MQYGEQPTKQESSTERSVNVPNDDGKNNLLFKGQLAEDSQDTLELLIKDALKGIFMEIFSFGNPEGRQALMEYIDKKLIEKVNYELCSQVWNECILQEEET